MNFKEKALIFLKGILMGICDLIPGISGGTIAFITGIYLRLINAVKGISPKLLYDLNKPKELKKDIKKLDPVFLLSLVLGIAVAILAGSRIIKFLLDNYFPYTLAFFMGLVLASSKIIFEHIKDHSIKNALFSILGFASGIALAAIIPSTITNPGMGYIFLGGFFAISAMFLPGISGAFILLIMGLYEFMINVLHNISSNVGSLLVFVVGALLGIFVISRLISFLFKKDKCKTLYFLIGLVIGSLSIPLKKIFQVSSLHPLNIFIIACFVILGILLILIIKGYKK